MHEREVLQAEISQRAKQVMCVGVRLCVYVCMCGMAIPLQPTGCVSVSMHVCVCVCVCQAQAAQDVGNRQAATTNVSFSFLFSIFLLYFEHPVQQRESEREREKGRVNVDKLGACLWLDGREVGGGEVNTGKSNTEIATKTIEVTCGR